MSILVPSWSPTAMDPDIPIGVPRVGGGGDRQTRPAHQLRRTSHPVTPAVAAMMPTRTPNAAPPGRDLRSTNPPPPNDGRDDGLQLTLAYTWRIGDDS